MCCSGGIWPGGKNCSCVWLFWCSVLCSAGQRATVQRESDLGGWVEGHCSVVRKLQELDRGVFRCAGICVEGEEQWGENTALRGASADGESPGCEFAQPH